MNLQKALKAALHPGPLLLPGSSHLNSLSTLNTEGVGRGCCESLVHEWREKEQRPRLCWALKDQPCRTELLNLGPDTDSLKTVSELSYFLEHSDDVQRW